MTPIRGWDYHFFRKGGIEFELNEGNAVPGKKASPLKMVYTTMLKVRNWMFTRRTLSFLLVLSWIGFSAIAQPKFTFGISAREIGIGQDNLINAKGKKSRPAKTAAFKEDLSIGVGEGDPNYMFGRGISINADDEGNIYVADYDRRQILKYNADGKYILTIGRQGQGPGEFQSIRAPIFDSQGNLNIYDFVKNSFIHFDRNGKYLSQTRLPSRYLEIFMSRLGNFVSIRYIGPEVLMDPPRMEHIYEILDQQFKPISEIYRLTINIPPPPQTKDPKSRAKEISNSLFQPGPSLALAENGCVYFGHSSEYRINVYSPSGQKMHLISRDCEPPKVQKEDIQRIEDSDADGNLRRESYSYKKQVLSLIRYPKSKPYFRELVPMEGGQLAVIVDYVKDTTILFDVFNAKGVFQGRFWAEIPMERLFFKNKKAYAVKTTEEGYKTVKRYTYRIQ